MAREIDTIISAPTPNGEEETGENFFLKTRKLEDDDLTGSSTKITPPTQLLSEPFLSYGHRANTAKPPLGF